MLRTASIRKLNSVSPIPKRSSSLLSKFENRNINHNFINNRFYAKLRKLQKDQRNLSSDRTPLENIRNVGIIAHIDAGKTTTTERMLFYSGFSNFIGDVDDGDTVTDYMDQERERGISITSASIAFTWRGHRINLIDTPGHVDFTVEVERAVRVLDGAVAIFDAVAGVEAQSKTVWKQADRYTVPRIAFVNKMDKVGADIHRCLRDIREKLGCVPLPVQMPVEDGGAFHGVVDLVTMERLSWHGEHAQHVHREPDLPADLRATAEQARMELVEEVADLDEEVADLYLEGEPVTATTLREALRRITVRDFQETEANELLGVAKERRGVVVMCGASLRHLGVQPVMDAVVDYLPRPDERPPPKRVESPVAKHMKKSKSQINTPQLQDKQLNALAFKVVHDRHRGPLVFFRIYAGEMHARSMLYNVTQDKKERPMKLLQIYADMDEEVDVVRAGNICAAVGMKHTATGDTLMAYEDRGTELAAGMMEGVTTPRPVFFCSIESETSADQKELDDALTALQREDPSFQVTYNEETGQTMVSGMGELHLDIIRDRLTREFNVSAEMGPVQISYRETMSTAQRRRRYYEYHMGGQSTAATVEIVAKPLTDSMGDDGKTTNEGNGSGEKGKRKNTTSTRVMEVNGNELVTQLDPEKCAPNDKAIQGYLADIEEGVRDGMNRGPLLGFPLQGVRITIVGGDIQPNSATSVIRACAAQAVEEAVAEGQARLLEPVMLVEITTDSKYVGDVVSDLAGHRRANVRNMEARLGNEHVITAEVPLSEMIGYSTAVRSITKGNTHYFMELERYSTVSQEEQRQIIKDMTGF